MATVKVKSRNVNGYVSAEVLHLRLAATYEARIGKLEALRRRVIAAKASALLKRQKLSGGKLAQATKLLKAVVIEPFTKVKKRGRDEQGLGSGGE